MSEPANLPEWDVNESNTVEPDTARKEDGFIVTTGIPEKPKYQHFNHWMNNVYKWVKHLKEDAIQVSSSIAELRTKTGAFQGQLCENSGHSTGGDGGGGPTRIWTLGAGQVDNGGSIITTGIGVPSVGGAWTYTADLYNVRDFGIKLDGTDESTLLQTIANLGFSFIIPGGALNLSVDVTGDFYSLAPIVFTGAGRIILNGAIPARSVSNIQIGQNDLVNGPAIRDAVYVGRDIIGDTDCHAFADRTIMSGVTDPGTYGSFDSVVKLEGSNNQNHVHAFQDRINYDGSGLLSNLKGYQSGPSHTGSGTVQVRAGIEINDISVTGGGTVDSNIGIKISNLANGNAVTALNIAQNTDRAIFASGNGTNYFKGNTGIGADNVGSNKLTITGTAVSSKEAFINTDASGIYFGTVQDVVLYTMVNGSARTIQNGLSGQYAFTPFGDDTQPLGDISHRWSDVYAGNAVIQTSDADLKTDIEDLDEIEIRVAAKLKGCIKKFRYINAVEEKGEDARIHIGVIAQEVKAAFESEGLVAERYGILCYDEWEAGGVVQSRYAIRYTELLAFIISAM